MRVVKNLKSYVKDKKIKIAYSICGVGHGHYGRNVEIIKFLSTNLKNSEITLYIYGDTLNIFNMDKKLPKNVKIKKIPGFKFIYEKNGVLNSMGSTFTDTENWTVFLRIIKLDFFHSSIFPIRRFLAKLFFNKDINLTRYYMKYFDDFDFAISDLEPLLPRIADVRKKPFLTLDNQHAMLYGELDLKEFNFKERMELVFIRNALKVYHPVSELSILTCFYKIPVKAKYKDRVKTIGPMIRENMRKYSSKTKYKDFILVYAHKMIADKLFSVLTKINTEKFIVFTTDDFKIENFSFNRDWIEFHKIDPVKFVDYMINCKAIISTAGNTLISEAVYFKKPFFAIGLEGNFEQRLNLYMLNKSKWGEGCKISKFTLTCIENFINNIEKYQKELLQTKITDNTDKISNLIINKINNDVVYMN